MSKRTRHSRTPLLIAAIAAIVAAGAIACLATMTDTLGAPSGTGAASAQESWFDADGKMYYRRSDGTLAKGLLRIGGKTYYLTDDGSAASGFARIAKDTYYFDPSTHEAATGRRTIDHKLYLFSNEGVMRRKLLQKNSDATLTYFGKDGTAVSGIVKVRGSIYCFDKETHRSQSGFKKVNGKLYCFHKKTYAARTGLIRRTSGKHAGAYSYFNKRCVAVAGLRKVKGKRYYFSPKNFRSQSGEQVIDGTSYWFDTESYELRAGWHENNSGVMTYYPEIAEEGALDVDAGERIARLAAQVAGYATGSVNSGGPHWPGWYANKGGLYRHSATGGSGKAGVYPNQDVGMDSSSYHLPEELTNLHDLWFIQDMTARYPILTGDWMRYSGCAQSDAEPIYAAMEPALESVMRTAYDPSFDYHKLIDGRAQAGAYEVFKVPFSSLGSTARPGDLIVGGDGMHGWIWIGSSIVREYKPDASGDAVMYTASGQTGRWPNIVRSQYGVWKGGRRATIYRPTGNAGITADFPLAVNLAPYGLTNAWGYDADAAEERQAYCDGHWPHTAHKGFGAYSDNGESNTSK